MDGQAAEIVDVIAHNRCMALHRKTVIDTVDAPALADFWAAALGYEVEDRTLIGHLLAAGHIDEGAVSEHRRRKMFRGYAAIRPG